MGGTVALRAVPSDAGRRLDAWLCERIPDLGRTAAARLCADGRVRADGRPVPKSFRLKGSETVEADLPDPVPVEIVPQDLPLSVVYEDDDVIVVDKPKGLVVHPAPGHPDGTLVNALLWHCGGSLSGIGGERRPGIVHRIDRDTSGLLAIAKNDAAHRALAAQLQDHAMSRTYRCIVTGAPRDDAGTIDAPIGRHPRDRKRMAVVPDGRRAVTHWTVVERLRGHADLECRLETGRTHQIRVHLARTGHPVLGDPVYGTPLKDGLGQYLHAVGLRFRHPRTGELVELTSPLPDAYLRMLTRLRDAGRGTI